MRNIRQRPFGRDDHDDLARLPFSNQRGRGGPCGRRRIHRSPDDVDEEPGGLHAPVRILAVHCHHQHRGPADLLAEVGIQLLCHLARGGIASHEGMNESRLHQGQRSLQAELGLRGRMATPVLFCDLGLDAGEDLEQHARPDRFEEIVDRAQAKRLLRKRELIVRGQDDHLDLRLLAPDRARGFQAIHPGHPYIHQDDVRSHLQRQCHGFLPGVRLTDRVQLQSRAPDNAAYRIAHDRFVVRDQQARHPYSSGPGSGICGDSSGRRIVTRVPRPRALSTWMRLRSPYSSSSRRITLVRPTAWPRGESIRRV